MGLLLEMRNESCALTTVERERERETKLCFKLIPTTTSAEGTWWNMRYYPLSVVSLVKKKNTHTAGLCQQCKHVTSALYLQM